MCILFLIIGLISLFLGLYAYENGRNCKQGSLMQRLYYTNMDECVATIGSILAGIMFIATIVLAIKVSYGNTIDKKLAMYEEENTMIESQIETAVSHYMNYEQDTFKNCSSESAIVLVDLYPELKSDSLVSKQIEVYLANNDKIKALKEESINMDVYRWWLYFGGK